VRLSKQIYITSLAEGWKGVYSPFGHKIAFLFDEAWEHLLHSSFNLVSEKIINYLIESNILVEDGFEEKWREENLISPQVRLNSMYLVITQNCNFRCSYCAVMENLDSPSRRAEKMSYRIGSLSVDFFERHLNQIQPSDARVTFYGGEPMLNQELIFKLVPKIRAIRYPNQSKPVEIVMITNGYLFNPAITDLFKEHNVGVCVSLDGKERHQDVTRRLRSSNEATFDRVIENYHRYKTAGLSMGISTALGSHNVFDLPEICEFYATELRPPFVEIQIPYQVSGESSDLWISTAEASKHLMEAYSVLRSFNIIEGTTYRRLRDFARGKIHYRDCGASGSQLVVAPDGMIGPCHSLVGTRKFFACNVADLSCDPSKMANFCEWASRFPLNMQVCKDCPFITICGGGCIYNSYVSTGNIWNIDPQVCIYMKEMVEWILRDLWKETGMADKYGVKCR
jgi:uncharacterized protein